MTTTLSYPLVCFDLDGTLVDNTIYIWETLHDGFGTDRQERRHAYDAYFSGQITYAEWFYHDLHLLRNAGATRDRIRQLFGSLRPMYGARETLYHLQRNGHRLAIISGSLDMVVQQVFPDIRFDYVLINHLYFAKDGTIFGGCPTPYDIERKADGLRYLCETEDISTDRTAFVGDNANDVWIAKTAGLSIAFNNKSNALAQNCHVEIEKKDLRHILPHIDSGNNGRLSVTTYE